MRFIEVGGIQTFVDLQEHEVLKVVGDQIAKRELDEKQQYIASNLTKRGVLKRVKIDEKLYYQRLR